MLNEDCVPLVHSGWNVNLFDKDKSGTKETNRNCRFRSHGRGTQRFAGRRQYPQSWENLFQRKGGCPESELEFL